MRPELSVVVPAFNESNRLPSTLARVDEYVTTNALFSMVEVIIVDDGSEDATADVARATLRLSGIEPSVIVHEHNRGKGAAVRSGFRQSQGAMVLLTDADLSAPLQEIERLYRALGPHSIAIGSRAVDRSLIAVKQPIHRDLMGRVFNGVERILAVGDIADTQCGFKLFPGPLARQLAAVQRLNGFAFDVELLLIARHWGYDIREVGVRWSHVEASRVHAVRHSAQMFRDLLRLAWWRLSSNLPPCPDKSEVRND